MIDLNKEHEVFEKWYSKMWIGSFDKSKCGEFYKAAKVNMSWLAWLESAKAKQSEIDELKLINFDSELHFDAAKKEIERLKSKLEKVESGEWVIVPKEPTPKMVDVGLQVREYTSGHVETIYKAMIEAAQENEDE